MAEHTNPHSDQPEDQHEGHGAVSHERRDIDVVRISAFGIGLLISCLITVALMWWMFDWMYKLEDRKNANISTAAMMKEKDQLPPEPRLQVRPRLELQEMKADEEAILTGYGWVDPTRNLVRIPINEAMDILSKRGLPYKASPAGTANDGYRMIPEDSSSGRTLERIGQ